MSADPDWVSIARWVVENYPDAPPDIMALAKERIAEYERDEAARRDRGGE